MNSPGGFPSLSADPVQAADHIPEYEAWIIARNVQKIKSTLLAKEQHDAVCQGMEAMGCALASLESMFQEFSSHNLLPAHAVSKLRGVQSSMKLVKVYNVSVHAIHLIVNRTPSRQAREKAALLRELLGCTRFCSMDLMFVWV